MRQTVLINKLTLAWYIHSSFNSANSIAEFFKANPEFSPEEWSAQDWEVPHEYHRQFRAGIDICIGRVITQTNQEQVDKRALEAHQKRTREMQLAEEAAAKGIHTIIRMSPLGAKGFAVEYKIKEHACGEIEAMILKTQQESTLETAHICELKIKKYNQTKADLQQRMSFLKLELESNGFGELLVLEGTQLLNLEVNMQTLQFVVPTQAGSQEANKTANGSSTANTPNPALAAIQEKLTAAKSSVDKGEPKVGDGK